MQKLFSDVSQLIGNTPIVKINRLVNQNSNLYAKLEYFNPGFSIKDRVALNMIKEAMNSGKISKNTTLIEPTSGNTGIGLSVVASVLGLKLILTMPENMSIERQKVLKFLGANVVLTPKALGMKGALEKAITLNNDLKDSIILSQFDNENNPKAHESFTAVEIFNDTEGKIDIFVCAIGTGGTISGTARKLKELNPDIKVIGIEPYESPLITKGEAGLHGIQGIGANFIPKNLDKSVIDGYITVKTKEAIMTAQNAAKKEGILCGISSGANLFGAIKVANENPDKFVLTVLPDLAERYLSTDLFRDI